MKRLVIILILLSLLAGCASLPESLAFLQPTQTSSPAPTPTAFGLPATFTPDLFAINTEEATTTPATGTPRVTDTPRPTFSPTIRPTITLEPLDVSLFTPGPQLFVATQRSTSQLVWGYGCDGARSVKLITTVIKKRGLYYVLLFVRLQDKYTGRKTPWGAGAIMSDNDKGTYFYTLHIDQIVGHEEFQDAWLQYQFVASTAGLTVLSRSIVSRTDISLTSCRALDTP
jgi:hypothetical protein